jgi:hypothetical protein
VGRKLATKKRSNLKSRKELLKLGFVLEEGLGR